MSLDYDELSIVTCDPWKRACGGVPRNSVVAIKLGAEAVDKEDQPFCDRIILAPVPASSPQQPEALPSPRGSLSPSGPPRGSPRPPRERGR